MDPQIETSELLKNLRPLMHIIAQDYNIDPKWLEGIAWQETGKIPSWLKRIFEGKQVVSPKGARGLTQVMPEVAAQYGKTVQDLDDPVTALTITAQELERLNRDFGGDLRQVFTAYNMGKHALATSGAMTGGTKVLDPQGRASFHGYNVNYNEVPKEARNYGASVISYIETLNAEEELENAVSDSLFVGPPYE